MIHCGSGGLFFLKLYAFQPSLPWQMSNLLSFEAALMRQFKPWHIKLWAFLTYIGPYLAYIKNSECFDMPIIFQNDIINDTENLMIKVFEVINSKLPSFKLPKKCIADAIRCLNYDSQAGTLLSQENMKKIKVSPMTEKLRNELARYTRELNIPKNIISFDNEIQI
uniref:Uncharacterized protein n=1 Tax=Panagrolaimus davidi TaxID=227884 RepID=A0A914QX79_9BILA